MSQWTNQEEQFLRDACTGVYGPISRRDLCLLVPRHPPGSVSMRLVRLGLLSKDSKIKKQSLAVTRLRRMVEMQNRVFL